MRDLKSLLIIILCFLIPLFICVYFGWDETDAKLSDDTLEEVETLRNKHYDYGTLQNLKAVEEWDNIIWDNCGIEWNRSYLKLWVEDGKLFVETQDGEWVVEMEKIEE